LTLALLRPYPRTTFKISYSDSPDQLRTGKPLAVSCPQLKRIVVSING
jgi:hypothetical protein